MSGNKKKKDENLPTRQAGKNMKKVIPPLINRLKKKNQKDLTLEAFLNATSRRTSDVVKKIRCPTLLKCRTPID